MGGAQETIQSINNLQLENNKPTSLTLSIRGEAEKPSNNNEQISNLEVYNSNKVCSKRYSMSWFQVFSLIFTLRYHIAYTLDIRIGREQQ